MFPKNDRLLDKQIEKREPQQERVKKHYTKEQFAEFAKKFWEDLKKPQNFQG
ncbi:hypothetical protein BST28156_00130 [Burkholderia stagnalis]|nr:hypothetical protein BST28156_00130 [Burkholderia stagnalis]